ncbi:ER membrane complex subunit 3 [Lobulomyces angularis]|nr:ER membrane complex subunit 3 [Lobulomyces angularis]
MTKIDTQAMLLDPAIRDWVLLPIMFVMVLVGIARHNVTILLNSTPKTNLKQIRENQALNRARSLRLLNQNLLPEIFQSKKDYIIKSFQERVYLANPDIENSNNNPMADPAGMEVMMEGLKKNMAMIVPQTLIMSWVNFFFSGFILIRLPFALTLRFKSMLQSGIATQDMDVAWVSSLSWYFLNLFGLQSIYTLVLGNGNSAGSMKDMQQMQMMGTPQTMQPKDIAKMFDSEREFLEISSHECLLDDVEIRLLEKYGKNLKEKHLKKNE